MNAWSFENDSPPPDRVRVGDVVLRPGDHVMLRPLGKRRHSRSRP